jgi:hypothetical protein
VWICPENGEPNGEVPGGFLKAVIPHFAPPAQDGKLHSQDRPMRRQLHIPKRGGNGEFAAFSTVVRAALHSPAHAAVKCTWSGNQKKTVPGLVLTAIPRLTGRDIAPFVPREARFTNDRVDLRYQEVSVSFISALLSAIRKYEHSMGGDDGDVMFTLIANLRRPETCAYTGVLRASQMTSLVKSIAPHAKGDSATLAALGYLTLNMGTDTQITINEKRSRITVPKTSRGDSGRD